MQGVYSQEDYLLEKNDLDLVVHNELPIKYHY